MKKLLVLAAVSAMAMGAKATYYTYTLDLEGAKAVYAALDCQSPDSKTTVAGYWNGEIRPLFFDKELADQTFGGETWAENYAAAETLFAKTSGKKFSEDGGSFSVKNEEWQTGGGSQAWALMVLTDATVLSPGAAYALYYGTSSNEGGAITIDSSPIETGTLMTDGSPTPAPEPTSGLLLLLGVAGLALKRKRA